MKGYKVFNPDWTCRDFQYEVGETYEIPESPIICELGFHFCEKASDCFSYYSFSSKNHVAEVEALGEVVTDNDGKFCTNKIHITREIPWDEVLRLVNEGKDCTGLRNTGNYNTGSCNTGDWNTGNRNTGNCNTGNCNTGDRNTGDFNTGDRNTGDSNTGDRNTGDWNTGNWNTGNRNTGNCNTGDWNKSSFNNGCFMTVKPKIMMFNKQSNWTYEEWMYSNVRCLLNQIPKRVVEWIYSWNMTDEEKAEHPEYKTIDGYLKVLDESECAQTWWDGLSQEDRDVIFNLPNFDADIFRECTGINVNKK